MKSLWVSFSTDRCEISSRRGPHIHQSMDEKSTEPVSIAYYCTGHGYGHATRSIEVITQILISIPLNNPMGAAMPCSKHYKAFASCNQYTSVEPVAGTGAITGALKECQMLHASHVQPSSQLA